MDNKDMLYVLPSAAISLFAAGSKMIQTPLLQSRETIVKSYSQGLYHITSDEAADKIIESGELRASGRFDSYGLHKRCFFFAGVPEFDNVCVNCTAATTLTAVRVHLPYEKLAEFDERSQNDGAISYKGDLSLEGARVEKVRLGLKEKDGELSYEPITEEEYKNYEVNLSEQKMRIVNDKLAFKLRSLVTGMRKEWEMFKENIKDFAKDETGGVLAFGKDKEDNTDLLVHTDEIPVEEISVQDETIQMFESINNIENKDDYKAELLKSIVNKTAVDISNGIKPNMDVFNITPGMSEKDMKDVLYTNLCNGNISGCYSMLDNPSVLFACCRTYVESKKEPEIYSSPGPVADYLNQEVDNYNNNLKSTQITY